MLFPFITVAGKVQDHGKLTGTREANQTHPQASRQCPTAGFAPRDRFTKPPVVQRRMQIPNLIKKEEEIKDSTKCMTNVQLRESLQTEAAR